MMLKMGKISIESMLKEVGRIFATDLGSYDKKHKSARSTKDYAMAALSVFYFKWPSFLQYEIQKQFPHIQKNLESLFSIKEAPSDTQVRERLDVVDPICFRGAFKKVFAMLQRNKVLEEYAFMDNHYLISIDGTGQYSSDKVHCDNCCVKNHKNGDVSYYHHMLGACMVHPERNRVIPFAPEPILKQDGNNKNDCERNASKRLLSDLRREHPHLKIIIVEDALAANGPHLKTLKELDMKYIIGVKPGDHKFLFDWVAHSEKTEHEYVDKEGTKHKFSFVNTVPLNDANFDLEVNFIEYWEEDKKGKKQHFSWITDIPVTKQNVHQLMRGGRSRWRIENETFNTLKNQGYNFEHNYGHGKLNLCTNMTMLMMLAFLIDQAQEICCRIFQSLRKLLGTYKSLWETLRSCMRLFTIESWEYFYKILLEAMSTPSG